MPTVLKDIANWVSHLLLDVGKAVVILGAVLGVLGGALYVWFAGASLTVLNESGHELADVRLLTGHRDTGIDLIWQADLAKNESKWSYTFTGKDRAVLRYVIRGQEIESKCLYPSEGLAVYAHMVVTPDGALTCESDMRM